MKTRTLLVVLLLTMLTIPLNAQRDRRSSLPDNLEGAIVFAYQEAQFVAGDDDTLSLQLTPFGLDASLVVWQPVVNITSYRVFDLVSDWEFADADLTVDARLVLDNDDGYNLRLTRPTYDIEDGSITFSVADLGTIDRDDLPELAIGSLSLFFNSDAYQSLISARQSRLDDMRAGELALPEYMFAEEDALSTTEGTSAGGLLMQAEEITFSEDDNGVLVTLTVATQFAPTLTWGDARRATIYPLLEIAEDWADAPDLTAEASILLEGQSVPYKLELAAPTYDLMSEVMTFRLVYDTEIPPFYDSTGRAFEPPEVSPGSVFIYLPADALEQLAAARLTEDADEGSVE
jgi:hypothetical protein